MKPLPPPFQNDVCVLKKAYVMIHKLEIPLKYPVGYI